MKCWLSLFLICIFTQKYHLLRSMMHATARKNCYNNNDNILLIAPCHLRAKLKSYWERSFQYATPTEWNKLPLLIRESPSLDILKTPLKTFYLNPHWNLVYYYSCFIIISYCAH